MTPRQTVSRANLLGFLGNVFLTVVKVGVGLLGHSQALLADGLHNLTDVGASVAVAVGLRIAHVPPDREHPYGHQKAESVSQKIVGILMLLAGSELLITSLRSIWLGHVERPALVAAYVAAVSLLLKEALYRYSVYAARIGRSKAMHASAVDHRTDVFASLAALIGIILARLVDPVFDSAVAALVSIVVMWSGWQLVARAVDDLMDRFQDQKLLEALRATALQVDGVQQVTGIRGRYMGAEVLLDVEIAVDGAMTVRAGHDVATEVRNRLEATHREVTGVHVHVNPVQ